MTVPRPRLPFLLAATLLATGGGCAHWPSPTTGFGPLAAATSGAPSTDATRPSSGPSQDGEPEPLLRFQSPGAESGPQNLQAPGAEGHYRYPMTASRAGDPQQPAAAMAPQSRYAQAPPPPSPYYGAPATQAGPVGPPPSAPPPGGPATFPSAAPPPPGVYSEPYILPPAPPLTLPGLGPVPSQIADVDVITEETQTGRFMFGVGVNSDAGLIGNIVVDERNFDITRFPTTWQDFADGTAFRGGGQGFRMEALPGTEVQRYTVSLTEPYLFGTQVSLNTSAFLFDRNFFDWDEQRYGGRFGFGYRLSPDLSVGMTMRAENVNIHDIRLPGVDPQLDSEAGKSDVFSGRVTLSHDTRDVSFAPTEGHLIQLSYEQVFGSFDYPRGDVDLRKYFLMWERPDGSGRHVLGYSFRVGASGEDTPIFDNYFAGGFSTLRGFDFRGASPKSGDITVGGRFQFLGSAEYMFPLTADDMLRGVVFCDFGTVEREIEIRSENYRVAPGFGLRIFVPAMGPAPLAFDFAFPVAKADTDTTQVFSFFIGFGR